jgi:ribosomal protein L32
MRRSTWAWKNHNMSKCKSCIRANIR